MKDTEMTEAYLLTYINDLLADLDKYLSILIADALISDELHIFEDESADDNEPLGNHQFALLT